MALRTIGFLAIYTLLLLAAPIAPVAAVWGFVFESNYHPPYNLWWGEPLSSLGERWSFIMGVAMILSTALKWGDNSAPVFSHRSTVFLVLFAINSCLVSLLSSYPTYSWEEATAILKWVIVYVCIAKTHSRTNYMQVTLIIYLLGAADAGWQCTFDPKHGRFARGGPTTAHFDENFVSAHVVAFLPLAGCYAVSALQSKWLRLFCVMAMPLMLNVAAHAQSRGTFLALLAMGAAMPFLASGALRRWTIAGLVAGVGACARLFDEGFWNRMSTIQTYQEDASASHRVDAWMNAWQLSLQNPFGYGGEAFDHGLRSVNISTHNMYVECLVAWGFQGVALWMAYILTAMWEGVRLIRQCAKSPVLASQQEYSDAVGIVVGMIGMLVAAVFLNRMRWELWYVLPAYIIALRNSVDATLAAVPGKRSFPEAGWLPGFESSRVVRS